jgi:hypothetical protein
MLCEGIASKQRAEKGVNKQGSIFVCGEVDLSSLSDLAIDLLSPHLTALHVRARFVEEGIVSACQ